MHTLAHPTLLYGLFKQQQQKKKTINNITYFHIPNKCDSNLCDGVISFSSTPLFYLSSSEFWNCCCCWWCCWSPMIILCNVLLRVISCETMRRNSQMCGQLKMNFCRMIDVHSRLEAHTCKSINCNYLKRINWFSSLIFISKGSTLYANQRVFFTLIQCDIQFLKCIYFRIIQLKSSFSEEGKSKQIEAVSF